MRRALLLSLLIALTACTGDIGPTGPQGPTGPSGPAGQSGQDGQDGADADIASLATRIAADGTAIIDFPGLRVEDSVINCWIAETLNGPWVAVASDVAEALACGAGNITGALRVVLIGGPPGFFFLVTVASA